MAVAAVIISACVLREIELAPPPNLYRESTNFPAGDVSQVLRTVWPRMFNVTYRAAELNGDVVSERSCFRRTLAVLSDIVLALRKRALPGGTRRPLEAAVGGRWLLHPDDPLERLPMLDVLIPR